MQLRRSLYTKKLELQWCCERKLDFIWSMNDVDVDAKWPAVDPTFIKCIYIFHGPFEISI